VDGWLKVHEEIYEFLFYQYLKFRNVNWTNIIVLNVLSCRQKGKVCTMPLLHHSNINTDSPTWSIQVIIAKAKCEVSAVLLSCYLV
jgi:hypothetical protein